MPCSYNYSLLVPRSSDGSVSITALASTMRFSTRRTDLARRTALQTESKGLRKAFSVCNYGAILKKRRHPLENTQKHGFTSWYSSRLMKISLKVGLQANLTPPRQAHNSLLSGCMTVTSACVCNGAILFRNISMKPGSMVVPPLTRICFFWLWATRAMCLQTTCSIGWSSDWQEVMAFSTNCCSGGASQLTLPPSRKGWNKASQQRLLVSVQSISLALLSWVHNASIWELHSGRSMLPLLQQFWKFYASSWAVTLYKNLQCSLPIIGSSQLIDKCFPR